MKILMVCIGNICRSPLAEGILQHKAHLAGLPWIVDSAGTERYHVGEAPHPLSQKVALLNGINISRQRARRFVPDDMQRYDKIFAMADDVLAAMRTLAKDKWQPEKADLLLNVLYPGENRSVTDPWYGEEPSYHEVFALIAKACDALMVQLKKEV
jgi:protein-tyrosine phosphatase